MNIGGSDEEILYVSVLPCEWFSKTYKNSYFYLTTADNFEGYILILNPFSKVNPLPKSVGLVMEFLDLMQVSEDGRDIFQKTFKNYAKQQCKYCNSLCHYLFLNDFLSELCTNRYYKYVCVIRVTCIKAKSASKLRNLVTN